MEVINGAGETFFPFPLKIFRRSCSKRQRPFSCRVIFPAHLKAGCLPPRARRQTASFYPFYFPGCALFLESRRDAAGRCAVLQCLVSNPSRS